MRLLRAAVLALAPAIVMQAATIGTLTLGGQAEVTLTTIDWTPFLVGAPYNGTGDVVVTAPATGIFNPLTTGNIGSILDRDALTTQPAGVPISVANWMTFGGLPGVALDLTFIFPGNFTQAECGLPANNQDTCTPPAIGTNVSPYNLSNFLHPTAGLSSNANFSVRGNVRNTSSNQIVGTFDGVFGAEFIGKSLEQVLSEVTGTPGYVVASYSATIVVSDVPEPSTLALGAAGALLLLASQALRRRA